jgi:hypothetical protein
MPTPAYLRNGRFDILAANDLGRALYSPLYEESDTPNTARFAFLNPAAREFFLEFDKVQDDAVAYLRAEAGRDPYDKDFQDLIGELSTRSERFRQRWAAAHDVRYHRNGAKRLHHPLVGDLSLDFEALELPGDEGQRLNIYTAPPHTPTAEALALLASWTLPQPISNSEISALGPSWQRPVRGAGSSPSVAMKRPVVPAPRVSCRVGGPVW